MGIPAHPCTQATSPTVSNVPHPCLPCPPVNWPPFPVNWSPNEQDHITDLSFPLGVELCVNLTFFNSKTYFSACIFLFEASFLCKIWTFVFWWSLSLSLWLSSSLSFCWSGHVFSSPWSNVSKVKSLKDCSLKVFSKCICICHCLCLLYLS